MKFEKLINELKANYDPAVYEKKKKEFEEVERRLKAQKFVNKLKASGLSISDYKRLKNFKFLIFKYLNKSSQQIRDKVARWYKDDYREKPFLVLYGNKGTAKTTLAKKLVLLWLNRSNALFIKKTELDLKLHNFDELDEFLEKLKIVNLLVIDDFGTGYDTDYKMSHIFAVLDYRYDNDLPTILTSNLNLTEETANIDETREKGFLKDFALLVDRLKEKAVFVEFDYPSLRDKDILAQARAGYIKTKYKKKEINYNF